VHIIEDVSVDSIATPSEVVKYLSGSRHWLRPASVNAAAGPPVEFNDGDPRDLAKALAAHSITPAHAVFLRIASAIPHPPIRDIPAIVDQIKSRKARDVILIPTGHANANEALALPQLLEELLVYPVRIWMALDIAAHLPKRFGQRSGRYRLVQLGTENLLEAANRRKRLFDIIGAGLLLTIVSPLMLLIALLLRCDGSGPVIFRQRRVGAFGRNFTVLKFRTMRHVADSAFSQAQPHDPRVTRLGRFLRRTSLDELPQLLNVLRGDMSLVGPRPHSSETTVEGISFDAAVQSYRIRHRVKPGITGLAQVRGQRGSTNRREALEQRIASDLEYIETWSLRLDLAIILRTLPVFFTQRNAY